MYSYDFRVTGQPFRLYSGTNALDRLPDEVARLKAKRAFVVCGRTVSRKTPLIARVKQLLGDRCGGLFDEVDKDTSRSSIMRAVEAARTAGADLIIGVGAGSVIQGARIVAILLAEKEPVERLVTQYPEHGPAVSPKLMAPKLPIVNVLTAPTTAQNRAGSRMKDDATGAGMEFFDPKTRPAAIFWDADALLTAPLSLIHTGAASVYWRAVMNLGGVAINPLVEGDRLQAYRLVAGALPRLENLASAGPRIELCAATLLQNREADDGGRQFEAHWVTRVTYAFSTALIGVFPHVGQGESYAALVGTVLARFGDRDPESMMRIATALGVSNGATPAQAPLLIAGRMAEVFRGLGLATRLSALGIDRARLSQVLDVSLRNFNADPKREFVKERDRLAETLEAAW